MKIKLSLLAMTLCASFSPQHYAATQISHTEVAMSGYIKMDAMWSKYSDGRLSSSSTGRHYYIPSLTPVGGQQQSAQFDSHARQSRFRLTTNSRLTDGSKIKGVFELDFLAKPGGNERVSNSYSPRIRHAYFEYGNWLVGQTYTTFFNTKSLPETLDFLGATDAVAFVRQPLIRYTKGNFQISLENPETTITPYGGGGRIDSDDSSLPDLSMRYTFRGGWGHIAVAGLLRQLSIEDKQKGADLSDTALSYGVSLTGKFRLGDDDFRFMANAGSGLGRYLGVNAANAAVLDANGELKAIDSFALSAAYRHVWSDKFRSTLSYSMFNAEHDTALSGYQVTSKTQSLRTNLLYSPVPNITVGAEYAHALRELESGMQGDMDRIQFSAKYVF